MAQVTKFFCDSDSRAQSSEFEHEQKRSSMFNIPGLFIGLSPKNSLDSDCIRSPTSPLEFRVFDNFRNSMRSPRSPLCGRHNSWGSSKVGLSIVDSLDDDIKTSGQLLRKSESRKSQNNQTHVDSNEVEHPLRRSFPISHTTTKISTSKATSGVLFEIGEVPPESDLFGKVQSFSVDSSNTKSGGERFCFNRPTKNSPTNLGEIELSEDYTCVISHGPDPKKTHIFCDCILGNFAKNGEVKSPRVTHSCDFLRFCFSCGKKLDEGKDIYIYRGEKSFCSSSCRLEEILMDPLEKDGDESSEVIAKCDNGSKKPFED